MGSALLFDNMLRFKMHAQNQEMLSPRDRGRESLSLIDHQELLDDVSLAKQKLLLNLLLIDALVLLLATVLAYFLSGKTLQPIEEVLLMQKRFVADAAHELRTPLTALKTALEVGLKDKQITTHEMRQLLKDNLQDVDNLEKLTGSLLILNQAERSVISPNELESVALDEVMQELMRKFKPLANRKKITLAGKAKHFVFKTNYSYLMQILSILLDNAIKFTNTNGKIDLHFFVADDRKLVFEVSDNGCGIKEADLPFIFDRFYKVDSSRNKAKTSGFGLGLSIAASLSKLLAAELTVQSKVGQGSTFSVSFVLN